jgi:PKD repeat protein
MISSDGAAPKFTCGTTGVFQGAARFFSTIGDLSPASNYNPDGTITMVLPKELFRSKAVCSGTCPALAPGQAISIALGSVRASPPGEVPGSGGTNETIPDSTGASSYTLRPATLCLPNNPPLAVLSGSASEGPAPLNVQFDGSASKDDDSIDKIASYTFNFGDGSDDVTQASPTISHTFANRGEYDVRLVVSDSRGKVSSNTAHLILEVGMDVGDPTPTPSPSPSATATPSVTPTPTPPPNARNVEFRNIATRVVVRGGDSTGIAGFILRGNTSKRVIVRGSGPSLKVNGEPLQGRLSDPIIELHDKDGALVALNDNWQDSPDRDAIQASGLAPEDPKEAAIITNIDSGAHTAVLRGANDSTGIGLVDIYDLDASSNSDLANVSTRAFVETSDNLLIGGFIVQGDIARRVVVRALGPSLAASGISDSLQNPTLELHDTNGELLMSDDNWKDSQEAEVRASGLPPSDDRESAIVRMLGPGAYTAVVRGAGGTTGTGLVEAYNVGP